MALKLVIRPTVDYAKPKAEAKQFTDELRRQDKAVTDYNKKLKQRETAFAQFMAKQRAAQKKQAAEEAKAREQHEKKWEDFFQRNETGFDRLRKSGKQWASDLGMAFQRGPLQGINQLQRGAEGLVKKLFSLKSVILGSAIGYGAYAIGRKTLHAGQEQLEAEARALRFEKSSGLDVRSLAGRTGLRAGVQGDDALRAIIPLAEAISATTTKGARRGGVAFSAKGFQTRNLEKARSLYERVQTLAPEISADQLGPMLAAAGTGPEGLRALASNLGINRAIVARVRKKAEKKHMGQGDVLEELLATAGLTEEAAAAKRKQFGFQMKSIGAQLEDALGDIGKTAMEKLNQKFGEGVTLAERLTKYLESDAGKKMIDSLGESLSKLVSFVADLAQKIPQAIGWVVDNKSTLMALGTLYAGIKVTGALSTPVIPGLGAGGNAGEGGAGGGGFLSSASKYVPAVGLAVTAGMAARQLAVPGFGGITVGDFGIGGGGVNVEAFKKLNEKMLAEQTTNVTVMIGSKQVAAEVKKEIIRGEKNSSPNH